MGIKSPVGEARNEYTYSASGQKLKVVQKWNPAFNTNPIIGSAVNVSSLTTSLTTDYVGNKIYENGTLKRILIVGGYIEGGKYHYYLTDHLGNNRAVAEANGTIIQQTQFYPFGMAFAESAGGEKQPYKYNNKELDTKHGLNTYDYSARYMAPDIGRFTSVDPLAEKYYSWSPYVYVMNNPLKWIDPTGMSHSGVGVYTDYRDEYGQSLFKTDDGLTDIIIVHDTQIPELEKRLNQLEEQGKLDDPKANKEELHVLGTEILDYPKKNMTGDDSIDSGFAIGYDFQYKKEPKWYEYTVTYGLMTFQSVSAEGAKIRGGFSIGTSKGESDRKSGKINAFKPFDGLKDNTPLIKLKTK